MGRGDLSNEQWARLAPLLPKGIKSGRPPKWSKRQLIDGIRWRARTGAPGGGGPGRARARGRRVRGSPGGPRAGRPGRDGPARYGPWQTVYGLFRRWQRDGTWKRILTQLQAQADACGLITWEVSVDTTVVRAHQHAAGARKGGSGNAKNRAGGATSRPTTRSAAPGVG